MKPKPNDSPKADNYLPNQPHSQITSLDGNIQVLPYDQLAGRPTNTPSLGLIPVYLVFILVVFTWLQNLRSRNSTTRCTIRFGNLFLVSFLNESSK